MWVKYYDSTVPASQKTAYIQNYSKMAPLIPVLQAATGGAKASATVTSVTFTSADHANVVFNILLNGAPALSGVNGQALLDPSSGQWQVSDVTLCALAQQAPGVTPALLSQAGCS
jgi:hypothetical protein